MEQTDKLQITITAQDLQTETSPFQQLKIWLFWSRGKNRQDN